MNQGCPPPCEYLAEYLILCQGVQHAEQDGMRTFSGGAALTGVRHWKASVPLRLPVLRGFKSILGFPFRVGCPWWWCEKGLSRKAGTSQSSIREGRCCPWMTKGTRSIPTPRRVWMSYHQLLLSALGGEGTSWIGMAASCLCRILRGAPLCLEWKWLPSEKGFLLVLGLFKKGQKN